MPLLESVLEAEGPPFIGGGGNDAEVVELLATCDDPVPLLLVPDPAETPFAICINIMAKALESCGDCELSIDDDEAVEAVLWVLLSDEASSPLVPLCFL